MIGRRPAAGSIAMTLAVAVALTACAPGESGQGLPNTVIVVADDLGRRDVSFHGGELATPNIDRIASEGVALERFYSAPVCSPTRAGLLTGRYPIRYGLMRSVIPPWRDYGLDTDEVLLPELLEEAGYTVRGIFGKWHLGHTSVRHHPLRRGFTEFVGGSVSAPVAYIDVLPTLLGIVGMEPPGERPLDGRDVLGVLAGGAADAPRDLYSYVAVGSGAVEQVAVIEPERKLVVVGPELTQPGAPEASRTLLYAIESDPHELEDVSRDRPETVARMMEKAIAFRALQPPDAVPPYNAGREGFVAPPNWKPADLP